MNHKINIRSIILPTLLSLLLSATAQADGSIVGKIYHPYVQPEEREIEWVMTYQKDSYRQKDNVLKHRLGYGQSISEYWFAEVSLIGEKSNNDNFDIEEIELEALWQITEQGEYDADWGMLFEYERSLQKNANEIAVGLIVEKEWSRWIGTANLKLIYEGGDDIKDEFETSLASQLRYRYSRELEPGIELYSSDNSKGIGPVIMGTHKLSGKKKLYWETGVIAGLDSKAADTTFKFVLEFEF